MEKYGSDIEKLARGDSEPFWKLYDDYYDRFFGYALDSLKETRHAEIIVEQSFEELWDNRQSLNIDLELEYQLFDIIVRRVLEALKCAASDAEQCEKIEQRIKKIQLAQCKSLISGQKVDFVWKSILNEILQRQLLHQLATTRR